MNLTELYDQAPLLVFCTATAFGLLIGSFLNVVIYRLPKMMELEWQAECDEYIRSKKPNADASRPSSSPPEVERFNLAFPNSCCPNCGTAIKPWQNIPVISYLVLGGKCASCKTKISIRYPIIEAVTGLLSLAVLMQFGATWQTAFGLVLIWSLIALTMIDIDHHLLPDVITLPLLWLGLLINSQGIFCTLEDAVYGAAGGYLFLWSVYWMFKLLTGKEGMGYGDFKLLGAFGAWLGWQYLGMILILSSLVGAVLGIAGILILGRDKAQPLPFGPYLAGAGLIALFWGDQILTHYLQFASPNS